MVTEILNREDTQSVLFMGLMSPENEAESCNSSWKRLKGLGSALQFWSQLFHRYPINLKCLFIICEIFCTVTIANRFYLLRTQQLEDCKVVKTMMNGTKQKSQTQIKMLTDWNIWVMLNKTAFIVDSVSLEREILMLNINN